MIVSEMVCVFLGARLMAGNPWVPFLLSCVINLLGIVLALVLLPETIHRKALTEATEGDPIVDEAVTTPKTDNSSSSIREIIAGVSDKFSGIRRNPGIILVLSSFFFVHMGTYGPSLILQYMAKKFGWTYENVSNSFSI